MLAVWGCRLGHPEHIGSYSDRASSFGILRTISRELPGAFKRRSIHIAEEFARRNVLQPPSERKMLEAFGRVELS